MARKSEAISQNGVQDHWSRVQKGMAVNAQEVKNNEGATTHLALSLANKRARDEFDDLMDWGPTISYGGHNSSTSKGSGGGGGGSRPPSGSNGAGGARATGISGGASRAAGAGTASKATREVHNSERLCLESEQTVKNLASAETMGHRFCEASEQPY